jgi:hypothetical protein
MSRLRFLRFPLITLAAICLIPGGAVGYITFMGHRLVVNVDQIKSDLRPDLAQFVPDDAHDICYAGRAARSWFYLRFDCEEAAFVEWYEALGFKVSIIEKPIELKDSFDYHYALPPRQAIIVEEGYTVSDRMANRTIHAVFNRRTSRAYVSGS